MIDCHSAKKYTTGTRLSLNHDTPQMRVETWRHEAGRLPEVHLESTEVAVMTAGRLNVERTGDGRRQRATATPGTFWLCPAGVHESDIVLSDTMLETVHIFLPPDLLGYTALEELDLDPALVRLDYAGGSFDPLLNQIALAFHSMSYSPDNKLDGLLSDSLRVTVAAHLLKSYLVSGPRRPDSRSQPGLLDEHRLKRVFDYIESRLEADFSLKSLADEACLSPFHFARSFHRTVGQTPFRYVMDRRIEKAKRMIQAKSIPLSEIAAETGFATQSGFTRTFKRITGLTPGDFRP